MSPKRLARGRTAAVLFLATSALASSSGLASVIDATWLGGNSSWHNPAGWNIGAVPNNGADTYDVTIPTSTVELNAPAVTIDNLLIGLSGALNVVNTSLTTTGGATIDGVASLTVGAPLRLGSAGLLAGTGTLHVGSVIGAATVTTSASSLTVDGGMHVAVHLGNLGEATKPFVNNGYIVGNGGYGHEARVVGSTLKNFGMMEAREGVLELRGTFTRADLGSLVWGHNGVFQIGGTLSNQSQVFNIGIGENWYVSGTIAGGIVNIDPGATFGVPYYGGATFDNVIINGKVTHGGGAPILNNNLLGNTEYVLSNRFLEGPSNIKSLTPMTVSPSVLVHGAGGFATIPNQFGNGSGLDAPAVINHGTIRSDSEWGVGPGIDGELGIYTPSLTNDGKLATLANSWLYASGNIAFAPGGMLDVQMSPTTNLGLLRVVGSLDLTTAGDSLLLTTSAGVQPNTFYRIVTTGGGVNGTFDSISPGFEVEYRNGNEIWARFVPEPAVASVMLVAASGIVSARRRRG